MSELIQIIEGTPLYVFAILAYILFTGIRRTKTSVIYPLRLFIIPIVLLAVQYEVFLSSNAAIFCLALTLTTSISCFVLLKQEVKKLPNIQAIEIPGSYWTLIVLLSFFIVKYYFGYLMFTDQSLAFKYSTIELIISGILTGYFLGQALCYTYKSKGESLNE